VLVAALVWMVDLWAQEQEVRGSAPGEELALVEKVVESRQQYEDALLRLVAFYKQTGADLKLRQAQDELEDLRKATKYDYVVLVDVLAVQPRPLRSIPEADALFKDAMAYKNYPADLFFFGKKEKLEVALRKFKQLITQYPESDKVAECAYRIAEIYEGPSFNEFLRAAKYFEATFRWDPQFPQPARWRAARIYDRKLQDYSEARRLYEICADESPFPDLREKAAERAQNLQARGF
jgi:hypothetical protein